VKQGPEPRPTPPRSVGGENSRGAEVSRTERQSEGAETNRGSLSRRVVPIETGETSSREPGSREGSGRVVAVSSETRVGPVPMESVSTRRRRIEMVAQRHPHEPLTALNQHLDLNWMHEAYRRVRKDAAPGVDGQTVAGYGEHLTENLRDLLARAKSGRYQAPPVKRAYVPKNEKEDRPIGLPTSFPLGSVPVARRIRRSNTCMSKVTRRRWRGCWRLIYASSSTRSDTNTFVSCWAAECRTE
jgi:hypothetical protein